MRIYKYFLLTIFSIAILQPEAKAQGQIKSFTEDALKYQQELITFFQTGTNDNSRKEVKEFLEAFTLMWNTAEFTDKYRSAVYKTSNLMLKKRLRPLPDFKSYLASIMNFISTKQNESSFAAWQESVDKILGGKAVKSFSDFIVMSENLFSDNIFYTSATGEWASSSNKYSFEFDSLPKVVFPSLNLIIRNAHGDSSIIYNTKGVYYPSLGQWIGQGGTMDWSRTGLDKGIVYAELKNYKGIVKTAGYVADSATFYNKEYFPAPLKGIVTEKVMPENDKGETYPRFESYNKRLQIKNIAENVDYDGGFAMRGAKFVGAGSAEEDAYLYFKRNEKRIIKAAAKNFTITKEKILSEVTAVKIFLDQDSIFHPYLSLKLNIKDKGLTLIRSDDGVARSPYTNTFHAVDMYFEELFWKTDEPKMEMRMLMGSTQVEADFESSNFFKEERYDNLLAYGDAIHPLIKIREYLKTNGDIREFDVVSLAKYMRVTTENLRPMLVKLSTMGFLIYDTGKDYVYVKERLFSYITARARKTDYDVINFHSVANGKGNASLNLLNNDLTIRGVNGILMSDSQNVVIYPRPTEIILKKDRNFTFAGIVKAGRFEFFGKEFSFDYDKFKVNLTNVDSLRMQVKSDVADQNGEYPLIRVKTVIQDINGDLQIDHPKNKSGIRNFAQYPIFNSFKKSFVYYDKKNIQKGAYKKDKFYFHLETFVIDSLDNFSNSRLRFDGNFVSGGIFPDIKETLTLQKDYSLGFIKTTPTEGLALYGGKGKFTNQIKLSNEGLKGDGEIDYVTSTAKSNEFTFYPDSTNGIAQSFIVKEQKTKPEFPAVTGENVYVHWMPKKDIMQVDKKDKNFICFNSQSELAGSLYLTPKLLRAGGIMKFATAELESKNMELASNKFKADTADFRLKDAMELAFSTDNVKAVIDFDQRTGDFKSNGKGSVVRFDVNKYICFMDNFKWNMDKATIDLGSSQKKAMAAANTNEDIELAGPEFISIHPDQDSLRFIAPMANYDIRNKIIKAREVPYINVADARVYPDSGFVTIRRDANMDTLKNSKILANTSTKYHSLFDAVAKITSRKRYTGSGNYNYVDEMRAKQVIYFSNIRVDTTFQTYAETNITDSVQFTLSPNFEYQGKVKLVARDKFLNYDGAARIVHECEAIPKTWFRFESQIDPNKIYIPVTKEPRNLENSVVPAGIMTTYDSTHLYSAFLSSKHAKSDMEVLQADGFLFFDRNAREYRISNKEKLVERNFPGNYLSFNISSCTVYGEGKMDLIKDLGQVKMQTVGTAKHFLIPDSSDFDVMILLDFYFDNGALGKMADAINESPDLKAVEFSRPVYEKGLRELLDKELADKLISQLNLYGNFKKFPDELEKSLFINDLKMKWNTASKSYISRGKIGLGNINKNQINKFVDGRVEIVKKKGGDILNIYLEAETNKWYFFSYTRGLMQAVSSDDNFNNIIKELKQDKREMSVEKGQPAYMYNLSTVAKKNTFLRKTKEAATAEEE